MDYSYLEPNFDPTSLRVADLRRILLFHDVHFPSSAKKSQLISLFSNNITPRAKEILEENSQVTRIRPRMEIIRHPKAQVQPRSGSPYPDKLEKLVVNPREGSDGCHTGQIISESSSLSYRKTAIASHTESGWYREERDQS